MSAADFFERHSDKIEYGAPSGCWLWSAATRGVGYGSASVGGGKSSSAHREAYKAAKGPIPDGLIVRHKCDVRVCVNPDHLELGTHKDNTQDCIRRGRFNQAKGEKHNRAKLTEDNVRFIRANYIPYHPELGYSALARRFGVSDRTVGGVLTRYSWKHVW